MAIKKYIGCMSVPDKDLAWTIARALERYDASYDIEINENHNESRLDVQLRISRNCDV